MYSKYHLNYYSRNRERILKITRKYRVVNREKVLKCSRKYHIKKTYGISIEEYEKMLKSQGYRCKICKNKYRYNLCIDHNHKNGKVRGLLCYSCNSSMGKFKDSVKMLQRVIKYLRGEL